MQRCKLNSRRLFVFPYKVCMHEPSCNSLFLCCLMLCNTASDNVLAHWCIEAYYEEGHCKEPSLLLDQFKFVPPITNGWRTAVAEISLVFAVFPKFTSCHARTPANLIIDISSCWRILWNCANCQQPTTWIPTRVVAKQKKLPVDIQHFSNANSSCWTWLCMSIRLDSSKTNER